MGLLEVPGIDASLQEMSRISNTIEDRIPYIDTVAIWLPHIETLSLITHGIKKYIGLILWITELVISIHECSNQYKHRLVDEITPLFIILASEKFKPTGRLL